MRVELPDVVLDVCLVAPNSHDRPYQAHLSWIAVSLLGEHRRVHRHGWGTAEVGALRDALDSPNVPPAIVDLAPPSLPDGLRGAVERAMGRPEIAVPAEEADAVAEEGLLEAVLRRAVRTGLDGVGETTIRGPYGMAIAASIEAQQSAVGIGIDVAVCTTIGNFWCRAEEGDDLSKWARGVWYDAVDAILGEMCARTAKKLSERPRRSNGAFHP